MVVFGTPTEVSVVPDLDGRPLGRGLDRTDDVSVHCRCIAGGGGFRGSHVRVSSVPEPSSILYLVSERRVSERVPCPEYKDVVVTYL